MTWWLICSTLRYKLFHTVDKSQQSKTFQHSKWVFCLSWTGLQIIASLRRNMKNITRLGRTRQLYLPLPFLVITKVCFPVQTNHLFIMRLFLAHYAEFMFVTEEQRLSCRWRIFFYVSIERKGTSAHACKMKQCSQLWCFVVGVVLIKNTNMYPQNALHTAEVGVCIEFVCGFSFVVVDVFGCIVSLIKIAFIHVLLIGLLFFFFYRYFNFKELCESFPEFYANYSFILMHFRLMSVVSFRVSDKPPFPRQKTSLFICLFLERKQIKMSDCKKILWDPAWSAVVVIHFGKEERKVTESWGLAAFLSLALIFQT